jgi:hypothetical protein
VVGRVSVLIDGARRGARSARDWFGSSIPTAPYGRSTTRGSVTPAIAMPTGATSTVAAVAATVAQMRRRGRDGGGAGASDACAAAATIASTCR